MPSFDTTFLSLQDPVLFDDFDVNALIAQSEYAGIEFPQHSLIPEMLCNSLEESSEGTKNTPRGSPIHSTVGEGVEISATVDPNFTKLLSEYTSLATQIQPHSPLVFPIKLCLWLFLL
jgi:hypothetical protein